MARIRTIKPDFFLHEGLAELPPMARLMFIGLWTLADREGRLEDRPRRIAAALFPYEVVPVEALLASLSRGGFIVRYEAGGQRYLAIPSWLRHQHPHQREAPSAIPAPAEGTPSEHSLSRAEHDLGSAEASPVPRPARGKGREGKEKEGKEENHGQVADATLLAVDAKGETPEALQAAWNDAATATGLPAWRDLTPKRKAAARARLSERRLDGPEGWREVIARIGRSSFCRGENGNGWRASPDWLLQPDVATKVLEGKYDDRKRPSLVLTPARAAAQFPAEMYRPPAGADMTRTRCSACDAETRWVEVGGDFNLAEHATPEGLPCPRGIARSA